MKPPFSNSLVGRSVGLLSGPSVEARGEGVLPVTLKGYPCGLINSTDVTWIESELNSNARTMLKSKFI